MKNVFKTTVRKIIDRRYNASFRSIESEDIRLFIPENSAWTFSENRYYEQNVVYWLKRVLADDQYRKAFYDIGANVGYYTLLASKFAKKVYAFEPVKDTLALLKINLRLNHHSNVVVIPKGISKKSGQILMNIYSASGNNSIFQRQIPKSHELKYIGKQKVKLDTIDNLLAKGVIEPPSVIKIDIEGAELNALKGAGRTIKHALPIIFCEYSEATSRDAGYHRSDITLLLKKMGYEVFGLNQKYEDNKLYRPSSAIFNGCDNIVAFPSEVYEKFV